MDSTHRKIEKVFSPELVPEGVGAKVRRIIGNKFFHKTSDFYHKKSCVGVKQLPRLDPFLLLDYCFVKLPAGFPDHPHRGFETMTYMQKGSFFHEDFKGHKGRIDPGDLQWMTAGKGTNNIYKFYEVLINLKELFMLRCLLLIRKNQ